MRRKADFGQSKTGFARGHLCGYQKRFVIADRRSVDSFLDVRITKMSLYKKAFTAVLQPRYVFSKNGSSLFLVCLLIVICASSIPGLSTNTVRSNATRREPPDLNSLIDGLQRKYSKMQGLGADFVQVYMGSDGRVIREAGELLLRRPGKARWEYKSPERKLFVSDGKKVFFYVYGEKTATVSSIKETVDPQIPFLFLLGRGNLRNDFLRIEVATGEPAAGSD